MSSALPVPPLNVFYTRKAYMDLLGFWPPTTLSDRDCMEAVMARWDGRVFDGDPIREKTARLALCEIGLWWSVPGGFPYTFSHVAERLREMYPAFGAAAVTPETMIQMYQFETDYPV